MKTIEELPKFESRRLRLEGRRDHWSKSCCEDEKKRENQIRGILRNNVGKYWYIALKEIHAKVQAPKDRTLAWYIEWNVVQYTWYEGGVLLYIPRYGNHTPTPLLNSGGWGYNRENYYVDPKGILCSYTCKKTKPVFAPPTTLPGKDDSEKYILANDIWYCVSFTPEQMEFIRTHSEAKTDNISCYIWDSYKKKYHDNKDGGRSIQLSEAKVITTTIETDHRGYPLKSLNFPKRYIRLWKDTLEGCLGKSVSLVYNSLYRLPSIYDYHDEVRNVIELGSMWIFDIPESNSHWTPYMFNQKGELAINPKKDTIKTQITVKPIVRVVGGKELAAIHTRINKLRHHHESK